MEIEELLQRIDKARTNALARARELEEAGTQAVESGDPTRALALEIGSTTEVSIARALDTILGLNTPAPLI